MVTWLSVTVNAPWAPTETVLEAATVAPFATKLLEETLTVLAKEVVSCKVKCNSE